MHFLLQFSDFLAVASENWNKAKHLQKWGGGKNKFGGPGKIPSRPPPGDATVPEPFWPPVQGLSTAALLANIWKEWNKRGI